MSKETIIKAGIKNYLEVTAEVTSSNTKIAGTGSLNFLNLIEIIRIKLKQNESLELFEGKSAEELIINELILKLKDEWVFPYQEEELCHCRAVVTSKVDKSIIMGAHTPEEVSLRTSASTSCGACREDVIQILNYRLK